MFFTIINRSILRPVDPHTPASQYAKTLIKAHQQTGDDDQRAIWVTFPHLNHHRPPIGLSLPAWNTLMERVRATAPLPFCAKRSLVKESNAQIIHAVITLTNPNVVDAIVQSWSSMTRDAFHIPPQRYLWERLQSLREDREDAIVIRVTGQNEDVTVPRAVMEGMAARLQEEWMVNVATPTEIFIPGSVELCPCLAKKLKTHTYCRECYCTARCYPVGVWQDIDRVNDMGASPGKKKKKRGNSSTIPTATPPSRTVPLVSTYDGVDVTKEKQSLMQRAIQRINKNLFRGSYDRLRVVSVHKIKQFFLVSVDGAGGSTCYHHPHGEPVRHDDARIFFSVFTHRGSAGIVQLCNAKDCNGNKAHTRGIPKDAPELIHRRRGMWMGSCFTPNNTAPTLAQDIFLDSFQKMNMAYAGRKRKLLTVANDDDDDDDDAPLKTSGLLRDMKPRGFEITLDGKKVEARRVHRDPTAEELENKVF